MKNRHLYILECEDGKLYTGVTTDLTRRFEEHRTGKGGHYTKYSHPKEILYYETFPSETSAKQREAQIKRWSHSKKQALIESNFERLRQLSISRDQ